MELRHAVLWGIFSHAEVKQMEGLVSQPNTLAQNEKSHFCCFCAKAPYKTFLLRKGGNPNASPLQRLYLVQSRHSVCSSTIRASIV